VTARATVARNARERHAVSRYKVRRLIIAAALFATTDARAQPALTAADVAQRIQATYASLNTFEADFDEQIDDKPFSTKTQRRGHLVFERGGKMRWDYTVPAGDVVFSDGTTLYSYDATSNVAYKMPAQRSAKPAALSFLAGSLAGPFTLSLLDAAQLKAAPGYALKAKPKATIATYNFALIYVTPSFAVRRVLTVDAKDARTRVDFSAPRFNPALGAATFQWAPPPSAKIVIVP